MSTSLLFMGCIADTVSSLRRRAPVQVSQVVDHPPPQLAVARALAAHAHPVQRARADAEIAGGLPGIEIARGVVIHGPGLLQMRGSPLKRPAPGPGREGVGQRRNLSPRAAPWRAPRRRGPTTRPVARETAACRHERTLEGRSPGVSSVRCPRSDRRHPPRAARPRAAEAVMAP